MAIVGANGAGKSSLLKAITGLVPPLGGPHPARRSGRHGETALPHGRPGCGPLPRGARDVRRPHACGRTSSWAPWPAKPGKGGDSRRSGGGLRAIPEAQGAVGTAHRHPLRRRAADGGHRPSPHGAAAPAAPGRAEPGARPPRHRRDLRHHPPARPGRDDHPAGGAERRPGAHRLDHRLPPGQRQDRPLGQERRAPGAPGAAPRLPGGRLEGQPGPEPPGGRGTDQHPIGEARYEQTHLHAAFHVGGGTQPPTSSRACSGPCGTRGRARPSTGPSLDAAGIGPEDIRSLDDLAKLPFITADDLRDDYPFPLAVGPLRADRAHPLLLGHHREAEDPLLHPEGRGRLGVTSSPAATRWPA